MLLGSVKPHMMVRSEGSCMKQLRAMATVLVVASGLACAATPLTLPGPVLGLDDKRATRAAILEGMAVRGWVVEQEVDRRFLARLNRRTHVAKVWIDYSGRQIEFSYGGSDGLECVDDGESCRSIHANYNKWTQNLATDISRKLTERRAVEEAPGAA
jgi:hypothetical protein